MTVPRFGTSQTRDEDGMLVRGAGQFTDDVVAPGALWLHVLRSPYAAGTITALDTSAAKAMPGVALVLTGADMEGLSPFGLRFVPPGCDVAPTSFLPLAVDAVHFAGEPVAAIVAETEAQAMDAADAIELNVADAPVVTDAAAALETAPVWDDRAGNTAFDLALGDSAEFEAACARAAHVVTARIEISRVTAMALEPRTGLATPLPEGRLRLRTGTQAPHRIRAEVTQALGLPPDAVQVAAEQTGGSFGMRNGAYPEDVLILMAARSLDRPVRWRATRSDSFLSDTQSREQSVTATLALDSDGRFLGLSLDGIAPIGAQIGPMAMHPMVSNLPGLVGVYRTPVIHARMRGMLVNTMHMAPYRGAGRPEAIYVMERLVDIAAAETGIDRIELRRRNLIPPDAMPYDTPLGYTYDSGDFPRALNAALDMADHAGFASRRAQSEARGLRRGFGLACAIEPAGGGPKGAQLPEFASISLGPEGMSLALGSGDAGQGHAVGFRQIAERLLGWTGATTVTRSDTDSVPQGTGTFGSRTMGAVGAALSDSARQIITAALPDAADCLEVAMPDLSFTEGAFRVIGTDRAISFEALIARTGRVYTADAFVATQAGTFPNAAHVAEVEIDPETGAARLLAYTVADDVGTVINPLLVAGQIQGGVAQGVGQALMERMVFDPDTGALLSGSLMDYAVPRANDMPSVALRHVPTPTQANPLGVKGAGEAGTVGALAATMNAVCDALGTCGIAHMDMPASPHRVWAALQHATAKETMP